MVLLIQRTVILTFPCLRSQWQKLMRDFSWSGTSGDNKIHLVSWDLVCRPKEEWVWVFGDWCTKIWLLLENGNGNSHYSLLPCGIEL